MSSWKDMTILEAMKEAQVDLKETGMYLKGSCPLKKEAAESFTVTPHRDIFYCFDCHAGGTPEEFMQKFYSTRVWE